jgi:hypothetical protein
MANAEKILRGMRPAGEVLTVPAAKPIKPFYIQQFVAMLDRMAESE